jgi:hypothetical protein
MSNGKDRRIDIGTGMIFRREQPNQIVPHPPSASAHS